MYRKTRDRAKFSFSYGVLNDTEKRKFCMLKLFKCCLKKIRPANKKKFFAFKLNFAVGVSFFGVLYYCTVLKEIILRKKDQLFQL